MAKPLLPFLPALMVQQNLNQITLASYLNVSEDVVYDWKIAHPEFAVAIKRGAEMREQRMTAEVEESLHEAAKKGKNIVAMIFWLKNRAPDRWSDHQTGENKNLKIRVRVINSYKLDGTPDKTTMTAVEVAAETGQGDSARIQTDRAAVSQAGETDKIAGIETSGGEIVP
jgi:hypothetical protein